MVIGDFLGYSSLGLGAMQGRSAHAPARQTVTLDAKLDPKAPNEYAVPISHQTIEPPQKASEPKSPAKRLNQNKDLASRTFFSVADFKPTIHKIDIYI